MKRMRTAVIAAVLLGVLAVGAAAASGIQQIIADLRPDITVEVDGMARTMTDKNGKTVYPISYEGTTYLPVRALGEILGQTVEWDSATQTVIMTEKVLEPAALYPTVDDLEKGMTRSEKAIDGLDPADTYVERARQYAALVGDLDDLRAVRSENEELRAQVAELTLLPAQSPRNCQKTSVRKLLLKIAQAQAAALEQNLLSERKPTDKH